MLPYVIRRILGAIPTLLVIISLAFFMMRIAPGGPFDANRRLPPEIEHNIKAAYNLDKPIPQQFLIYVGRLAHGDFGPSYKNKDFSVGELIEEGLPVSAKLGLSAIVLAILFGTCLGVVAALHQNKGTDYGVMAIAMFGITIPTFVTAPILTLIFGVYGLSVFGYDISLPVGGWNDGAIRNMILPVIVLALPQIAIISRLVRGSMIEVLHSNYIRTARAKGLPNRVVLVRHALRAGLLPLVSYLGPAVAALITGSLVVEQIFGLPGIGRYFIQGALNRDYTMVMGVVIFYAAFIILLNLVADVLYRVLDPRVSFD
ncbi:MAG TPA: oligopeptide ABC transporter permease OppB [Rhizomicrobium sp.]|jgi:oligopeptide transport system permease protein|nr:oligopeptide ABC transporter permease OppB [Rhizomicrobium sp.]HEX4532662.1 oligopeptide ABC transporter permease OppB [Rhizomicrobium sp.]